MTESQVMSGAADYRTAMTLCASDGRVGGFQAHSAFCAEPGCLYVLISAVRKIRRGTRCPVHR